MRNAKRGQPYTLETILTHPGMFDAGTAFVKRSDYDTAIEAREAAEQRVREVEALRQKLIAEIAQYDETCDPSDPEDWVAPLRTVVNELEAALQGTGSGSADNG